VALSIQAFEAATLSCSEGEFTATGFAICPATGTRSQLRRPDPPARIELECPNPATRIGLASLLIPTSRAPLVRTGDLPLLVAGLVAAVIACEDEAGWFFDPGPVTEVRVSTTLLPV